VASARGHILPKGVETEYFYGQLKVQAGRIIGWIDEEVITYCSS
jgi:hypothetical protein